MQILPPKKNKAHILLPASKSESNRMLMINYLSGNKIEIKNLSHSNDTRVFQKIISSTSKQSVYNAEDAGTAFRFSTALFSVKEGKHILTGSERMKERPVGILTEALKMLGIKIEYLEKQYFPPLAIYGKHKIAGGTVNLDAGVSSQYISALMMIAPLFDKGLTLQFNTVPVSLPYIKMTAALMQKFGIDIKLHTNSIVIKSGQYTSGKHEIENDWSAASYWYLLAALYDECEFDFDLLSPNSLQGDSAVINLFNYFGIETVFNDTGCTIKKSKKKPPDYFEYNFSNCPDLAQTFACLCTGLRIKAHLTGLNTLKIKETDRIEALKNELCKFGAIIAADNNSLKINGYNNPENNITINTYNDHRMAMSFAPLTKIYGLITIQNPDVVKKSYPQFWLEWKKLL